MNERLECASNEEIFELWCWCRDAARDFVPPMPESTTRFPCDVMHAAYCLLASFGRRRTRCRCKAVSVEFDLKDSCEQTLM